MPAYEKIDSKTVGYNPPMVTLSKELLETDREMWVGRKAAAQEQIDKLDGALNLLKE